MKKLAALAIASTVLLSACSSKPYDYSAFQAHYPKSIVVLTPENNSLDVKATDSVLSVVSQPLADDGYYVFPVALVDQVLKQNGVTDGNIARQISATKLRQIFGADAALYLKITNYGTKYMVFDSVTQVTVDATLVDLKTGKVLWTKEVTADDSNGQSAGLLGSLIKQVMDNLGDQAHVVAAQAGDMLFVTGSDGDILYGPKSPYFHQDPQIAKK
ncbi:hypothetical protein A6A19_05330 [Actinobacillus delphinicola]|uniref:Lipoprotein n=1 Tax=Actinobacillus delphinicola TaxID=51161 RepID=A0A448TTN6_9PAST|nr:GNA1162 family protein [Actinobacillus delphinicola]MDG6897419.1 hypothetical protein [Actinobacillus delphinicola]VEJ09359.1 lipoprotein [Actinobacillus delphinicola]